MSIEILVIRLETRNNRPQMVKFLIGFVKILPHVGGCSIFIRRLVIEILYLFRELKDMFFEVLDLFGLELAESFDLF
jgi:hypothetical protein